ncbi:MAG: glycosyltransferase family 9 protein [Thermodesulfobacteriota bacterium]
MKASASRTAAGGGATGGRRRILLLFPGALGDAVCLEPAVAYLAAQGELTLYARGAAADVAALYPAAPQVRSLDAPEVARLFSPGEDEPGGASWLDGFTRVVSFTGAGVPQVERRLGATGRATLAAFPRAPAERHASDYFLGVVCGDREATAPPPRLRIRDAAGARDRPSGSRWCLVLLPGSGGRDKRASRALYADVARRWRAARGEVVVLLGPAEQGEDVAWQSIGRVQRPSSIAELAHALASCRAFVGNDAGPSHVAAALGVAGAVLYRTTSPAAFGPRGRAITAVRVDDAAPEATADAAWHAVCRRLP